MIETLPAKWYTDPAIHRRERAAIGDLAWLAGAWVGTKSSGA